MNRGPTYDYGADWEANQILINKQYELIYSEDFRTNIKSHLAVTILMRAGHHVVGLDTYEFYLGRD